MSPVQCADTNIRESNNMQKKKNVAVCARPYTPHPLNVSAQSGWCLVSEVCVYGVAIVVLGTRLTTFNRSKLLICAGEQSIIVRIYGHTRLQAVLCITSASRLRHSIDCYFKSISKGWIAWLERHLWVEQCHPSPCKSDTFLYGSSFLTWWCFES